MCALKSRFSAFPAGVILVATLILFTHLSPAAAGPARAEAAQKPSSSTEADPFAKLRADWAAALHAKQLDSLVMLYAPDAVFVQPDGQRATGRPAIRDVCKKAMDTFTSDITLRSIASERAGNLGYDSGDYHETLTANSDGSRSHAQGSYLMVLKPQRDGHWLIQEQVWTGTSTAPQH